VAARPLGKTVPAEEICLELTDHGAYRQPAARFFKVEGARDRNAAAARLAQQFTEQNRGLLSLLDARAQTLFDGREVWIELHSGSSIGAIPLISPTSAQPDFGLVIQPRFPWSGLGPMLAEMGWKVVPSPLRLPALKRSERRVPRWVLSSMILTRMEALLKSLGRKFSMAERTCPAPRGQVQWGRYATQSIASGQWLAVPCRFPELGADEMIRGAIRFTLEQQLQALGTQSGEGVHVHRLLDMACGLLRQVEDVPRRAISSQQLAAWTQRPMRTAAWTEGLEAMEWSLEERGLAGQSDLEGIPWRMPMEQFFEAWVERVFAEVARRTGARLRSARLGETTVPLDWRPAWLGSQGSLKPDLWLEWPDATLVVDAKYKRHWEDLRLSSWRDIETEIREQHRHDLHQILAYSTLTSAPDVSACLVYPSLRDEPLSTHATLATGPRRLHLHLTGIPISAHIDPIATRLANSLRPS
jgi:hypothetical protein